MSNQGLHYYNNEYNRIEESRYYPLPSQNRQIIEDYPSDRGHKRDKKWSFSNLFRRNKKKDNYSGSSSEEEQKKGGFLQRKRKPDGRKKTKNVGTFDHVVVPTIQRNVVATSNKPSSYINPKIETSLQKINADSYESLQSSKRCLSRSSCASTSLDSFGRKSRRDLVKARVEAKRDCLKTESSSEEDSQRSASSSVTKFKSDDSVGRSRDNSITRKSRTARTERYVNRRSSRESLNTVGVQNCNSCNGLPEVYYKPQLAVTDGNYHHQYPTPIVNHVKPEPPPPPPRDPQRRLIIGHSVENGRPVSYSFEIDQQETTPPLRKNCGSSTSIQSYNSDFVVGRSNVYNNHQQNQRESTPFRSSSVNSEPIRRYIRRHPSRLQEPVANIPDRYNYFADHQPRSRKPIIIQASNLPENKYLSDSQIMTRQSIPKPVKPNGYSKPTPNVTARPVQPSPIDTFKVQVTKDEGGLISTVAVKTRKPPSEVTPPKPKVLTYSKSEEKEDKPVVLAERRSSSNLEDALNELEAIYNSLRLGDEDLLDRAEQREIQSRLQHKTTDPMKVCGSMSDSGFDFDYQDRHRFKRSFLKSNLKKSDDMAERKLQQHQSIPAVAELEKGLTQISYLLASPVHNSIDSFCAKANPDEPDVTLDDVVFRNIKHINNTLKTVDPQPPFGIPLGPIAAAANSDYLHAVPNGTTIKQRNNFKPNKIPDIVNDDLAYRSLRKDFNRDIALPNLTADDYINNNKNMQMPMRKKQAVRSLSANIYNILHGDSYYNTETMGKAKSITDIKDEIDRASPNDTNRTDGKSELHQKVQVYVPLYEGDVIVNSKPPSGLIKSNSKRATPSPVPRPVDGVVDVQGEKSPPPSTVERQEAIITEVAEHAKMCEKLLECVIESTELISQNKAVIEVVPEEEPLADIEEVVPPTLATVTESAEAQLTTLVVEPITVEMVSESDDHDYENLPAADDDKPVVEIVSAESSESSTLTPVEQTVADEVVDEEVNCEGVQ